MGKNQSLSNLTNIIKQDGSGNIVFTSGSTTLATISTAGQLSGSTPALSASYAATASYATNFNVSGTITATTLVVQTITSSVSTITGSTKFGIIDSNTHQFTGSMLVSGSLNLNGAASIIGALTTGNGLSAYTFGGGSAAAGGLTDKDLTLKAWSPTSGTNEYGGNLILSAGVGTGNTSGKLGSVIINAGTEGTTSSALGTLTTVATFTKTGLGIGTSTITAPLTIAYPATGSSIAASTSQQSYDYARLRIKHYSDSNVGLSVGYAGGNTTYIQTSYNEGTTSPLIINPFGGNVGIGTTSSAGSLQVRKNFFQLYAEKQHGSNSNFLNVNFNSATGAAIVQIAHASYKPGVNTYSAIITYYLNYDGVTLSVNTVTASGAGSTGVLGTTTAGGGSVTFYFVHNGGTNYSNAAITVQTVGNNNTETTVTVSLL